MTCLNVFVCMCMDTSECLCILLFCEQNSVSEFRLRVIPTDSDPRRYHNLFFCKRMNINVSPHYDSVKL